jgi:CRISPR-associated protein Cas1
LAWRVLLVQNPANLTIEHDQIALRNDEGRFTLPVEDVQAIILETPQATLTSWLLATCQSQGVVLVTCDARHMPNGLLLPFLPHSRAGQIARLQQSWSASFRNRLWQRVIQTKIRNQGACLRRVGRPGAETLDVLAARVASGDPDNSEARAAREYWPLLLGAAFRRGRVDGVNAALNYGYAIVRAHVARAQVAFGLVPVFGIHHDNDLNAFNLTDDMMEVFRPFVDQCVFRMIEAGLLSPDVGDLSKEARQKLAAIGAAPCQIGEQIHTLANACDKQAASLVDALRRKEVRALLGPDLPPADDSVVEAT